MNKRQQLMLTAGLAMALILTMIPAAAMLRAEDSAKPMQSHDFTDVPFPGKEFMEPFIDAFYHLGITNGCGTSPLMYCPEDPVTRGSMAVFMGRALGYVDAENVGYITRAYFKQTLPGVNSHGVIGESVDGRGVFGISVSGPGVRGQSTASTGISGISTNNYGVRGLSDNAYGVYALSSTQTALYARGDTNGTDSLTDQLYDFELGGTIGEAHGAWLNLLSDSSIQLRLDTDNDSTSAFSIINGLGGAVFGVDESGNFTAAGTKSAIVDTVSHGTRTLYAVESTEVWFEDAGSAQLVDGEAVIEFEDIFAETVNLEEDYQVFLTPVGSATLLYVAEQTSTSFTVRADGSESLQFHYRIMAKRLGYEDVRLEEVED